MQLLSLAALTIAESKNEVRERCCGPTYQKLVALETQLLDAMKEGVTEESAPTHGITFGPEDVHTGIAVLEKKLSAVVSDTIRAVHAEFMAGQTPAA